MCILGKMCILGAEWNWRCSSIGKAKVEGSIHGDRDIASGEFRYPITYTALL